MRGGAIAKLCQTHQKGRHKCGCGDWRAVEGCSRRLNHAPRRYPFSVHRGSNHPGGRHRFDHWNIFRPDGRNTLAICGATNRQPPAWMASSWFRLVILVLGLSVIWVSFNFNRWSVRQRTIDGLAEDISWAIDNLLNRHPGIDPDAKFIDNWKSDFEKWCAGVSKKLGNRAFFTRADQLHFDYLGFIDPIQFYQNLQLNHLLASCE